MNPIKTQDTEIKELEESLSALSNIIKHLEKNPSTMREAFFIELVNAFKVMDDSFKKRAIGLNTRLMSLNKSIEQIQSIDILIQNKVLEALDSKLDIVLNEFEKKLSTLSSPIEKTNKDFKIVGKAFIELELRLNEKLKTIVEISEKTASYNQKLNNYKAMIITLILSNFALIAALAFSLFKS